MPAVVTDPFELRTGKVNLPAGKYTRTCFYASGNRLLLIRSTDGKTRRAAVQTIPVNGRWRDGRLVFHRYGDRYFFVQMWAGGNTGLELPMTHAERTVARELAGIKLKRETIALSVRE